MQGDRLFSYLESNGYTVIQFISCSLTLHLWQTEDARLSGRPTSQEVSGLLQALQFQAVQRIEDFPALAIELFDASPLMGELAAQLLHKLLILSPHLHFQSLEDRWQLLYFPGLELMIWAPCIFIQWVKVCTSLRSWGYLAWRQRFDIIPTLRLDSHDHHSSTYCRQNQGHRCPSSVSMERCILMPFPLSQRACSVHLSHSL